MGFIWRFLPKKIRSGILVTDKNAISLSTLQKIAAEDNAEDDFLLQTKMRLAAHILEKGLIQGYKRPRNLQFYRLLESLFGQYKGPNTVTIDWARKVWQSYQSRYEL